MQYDTTDQTPTTQRVWQLWLLICLVSALVQISVLGFSPPLQQDEVQIVDFGRIALQSDTDWALTWNVGEERPVSVIPYLGPVLQELAFRVTQPSHFGPRLLALLGAMFAGTCLLGWFLVRGTPGIAALILASAFLLDPTFSTSYREARVDSWAFASALLACWLLRIAISNELKYRYKLVVVALAGAALAAAPFFWPSAFMLVPLVLLEFTYLLRAQVMTGGDKRYPGLIPVSSAFVAGGSLASVVLLFPVFLNWDSHLSGLQFALSVQQHSATLPSSLFDLVAVYEPLIALAALAALVFKREWGLLLVLCMAIVLMYQTRIYPQRLIYLLPYVFTIIAGAATVAWSNDRRFWSKAIMSRVMAFLLIWNGSLVLVIRPAIAFHEKASSDLTLMMPALKSAIGTGPFRVLLEDWAAYYSARNLGWKIYRSGLVFPGPAYAELLQTMDYVIVQERPLYDITKSLIDDNPKFELHAKIQFEPNNSRSVIWGPIRIPITGHTYPTLLVFRKLN